MFLNLVANIDMIIDTTACTGLPDKEKEQRQRQLQALDATASQTKRRRDLDAEHASLIQRRNASNASTEMKVVNPTLQEATAGSSDVQKR